MCIFAWLKTITTSAAVLLLVALCADSVLAQTAPASSNHPWLASREQYIKRDAGLVRDSVSTIDAAKTYSLAELIDFAEANNPETRFAWERARAQAAALGVARSELYPTIWQMRKPTSELQKPESRLHVIRLPTRFGQLTRV